CIELYFTPSHDCKITHDDSSFLFGVGDFTNFLIKKFAKISGYAPTISVKIVLHILAELRFCLVCSFQKLL
ncbi:hypothetical protein, partial [Frisingicoccus sp.]|uniref:hypothetical protein n=1 Tax=Frisingicoccus sp. TaxID=1918627 RepID=UPI003734D842